jgi:hypothetical protein
VTSHAGIRLGLPGYLAAAAAAAAAAASVLPWWSSGLGSAIAPTQFSALVLSGGFGALVPRLLGTALLLPLLAVAFLLASFGLSRGVRPARASAFVCLAVVGAVVMWSPNRGSLGAGSLAVLAGAGLSLAAFLIDRSSPSARPNVGRRK